MKINIGTLSGIIKNGDEVGDLLRGGNTPQTIEKIKVVLADRNKLGRLLTALDNLELNLRALKLSTVEADSTE